MKAQNLSFPAVPTTVIDVVDGVSAEQFTAWVQDPDGLLEVLRVVCRQVVGSLRVVSLPGHRPQVAHPDPPAQTRRQPDIPT